MRAARDQNAHRARSKLAHILAQLRSRAGLPHLESRGMGCVQRDTRPWCGPPVCPRGNGPSVSLMQVRSQAVARRTGNSKRENEVEANACSPAMLFPAYSVPFVCGWPAGSSFRTQPETRRDSERLVWRNPRRDWKAFTD
jgi:hypothetical protein